MSRMIPSPTVWRAAIVALTMASIVAVPAIAQERVPIKGVDPVPTEQAPTRERTPAPPGAVPVIESNKDQGDQAPVRRITTPVPGSVPVAEDGYVPADPMPAPRAEPSAEDGTPVPTVINPPVEDQIAPASGAPHVLVHDTYVVEKDGVLSIDVGAGLLANDYDPEGDTITISFLNGVTNGSPLVFGDGHFTFTPTPGYVGPAGFTYYANDGTNPNTSATVVIQVVPDSDRPPVAVDDSYQVERNEILTVVAPGLLDNDYDPDGDSPVVTLIIDGADNGYLTVFGDGRFNYTPDPGFYGVDFFQYRITANGQTAVATATITVTQSDRAPVGVDDHYNVNMNGELVISAPGLLGNDYDPDGDSIAVSLILDGADNGSQIVFPDGRFTYTPDIGFSGEDSFTYRVSSNGLNSTAVAWITVVDPSNPPIAVVDAYYTPYNTPLAVTSAAGLLHNDIDPDGDAIVVNLITDGVDHGSLAVFQDGHFSYTPDPGFFGVDSFTYRIGDAYGDQATAKVTLLVGVLGSILSPTPMMPDPDHFLLRTPTPNPFNPSTRLDFRVEGSATTVLRLYDIKGRLVRTLVNEELAAGDHSAVWDGHDDNGMNVASGTYFAALQSGEHHAVQKLLLVK